MGLHRGVYFYATCIHQGCRAFLLPSPSCDPAGMGAVIAGQYHVFKLARENGWQAPADKDDDTWLCPEHRTKPPAKTASVEVVDLFGTEG
ncbi:hypothetical protein [Micromonospora carbonacea]|uniref:Uncharacterized protein n=1 Tax=Micromonospora carbonacea TaxID=47853 RepID=A0A1C5A9I2_9ACTN|nr:hypothetical protein [Micromonospora carbonacea]SCF41877.1 hypothetical protein GA0070563_11210 [Micromonospora carbonacea]